MKIFNNESGIADAGVFNALRKNTGATGLFKKAIDSDKAEQCEVLMIPKDVLVRDLEFLKWVPNLEDFSVHLAPGGNIEGVRHLRRVMDISITAESYDTDITPLGNCMTLTDLMLRTSTKVAGFSGYEVLGKLRMLETLLIHGMSEDETYDASYSNVGLRDISWIGQLTQLVNLELMGNHIDDVSPIFGISRLLSLDLSSCGIRNISGIEKMSSLEDLFLNGNPIEDLSPICGLKPLLTLEMMDCGLTRVGALAGASIEEIILNKNEIIDLEKLAEVKTLGHLDAKDNNLRKEEKKRLEKLFTDKGIEILL